MDLQKKRFGTGHVDGQTYTYLGHVALLEGKLNDATFYYCKAQAADKDFNVYTLMGQVALAVRQQDLTSAEAAYEQYRDALVAMADEAVKALPIAVITAGLYRLSPNRYQSEAEAALKKLIAANYAIEALYLLPMLRTPARAKLYSADINRCLEPWVEAIQTLPVEWRGEEADPTSPTPANLHRAFNKALKSKNGAWDALTPYLAHIFPMNLLGVF